MGGWNIYSSPTTKLDDELSYTSINAVQNKVINEELNYKADLDSNNTFSGNNNFIGENTFANGYIVMNDTGLTIKGMQGRILLTDLSGMRLLYHGNEIATKKDLPTNSIDEQSLMVLLCGESNIRVYTDAADWVTTDRTACYVYKDKDITPSDKAAACDLDAYEVLKTVCGNGTITIYYPDKPIPPNGVYLLIKY